MRIDNGAPPPPQAAPLDARVKLKRYLQAIRRHWYLVAIFAIVGAGLGWVSAPSTEAPEIIVKRTTYYTATHTLLQQADDDGTDPVDNLAQTAYLVGKGDVPTAVAERLDLDVDDVEGAVVGIPRYQVASIEIQAVDKDADRAVAVANTSAEVLLEMLQEQAVADFESEQEEFNTRLEDLDKVIAALDAQIASNPDNRTQLEAQRTSANNRYAAMYEQSSQLTDGPAPTSGFETLQVAKATKIDEDKYDEIKEAIVEGLPYVTGAQPEVAAEQGGSRSDPGPGAGATTRSIVGLIVGLGAAIALILGLDRFDNRMWHRDDVELTSGLPVLAEIPPLTRSEQASHEVVAHAQHRSRAAEAYRVVRSAVLFAEEASVAERPEGSGLVVMVTSPNPAEGKTTTTANLAAVMAEGGFSVLVINCDFRRPRIHSYLAGGSDEHGQQTVPGATPSTSSVVVTATDIERVKLVSSIGMDDPDANPLEVVAAQRKVIQVARKSYDIVLLDTAPFLTTNDASDLLSETDQIVLVVRAGSTRELAVRRISEVLGRLKAPVLGIVLNDSSETPAAQYYYNDSTEGSVK